MTAAEAGSSPRRLARIAAVFYLGTIVTGALSLALPAYRTVVNLAATACYVAVTLLFYRLFKPVSPGVSRVAAVIGLVGCVQGALASFGAAPFGINSLVIFGFYCILIGYLVVRSTFLPPVLGILMAFGGLGWLTFVSRAVSRPLAPYNMIPGILGETVLTLWLLVFAVDARRWHERAAGGRAGAPM